MDWAAGMQSAVDYIEEHITEQLDYAEIARRAACSPFYFQRIFGLLCGLSLGEYIRNRRLTLAGSELCLKGAKVIDTALKYGYDSPESFSRAFVRFHGTPPSEARKDGSRLRSFSRVSVQLTLKGGHMMDYEIVKKPAFRLLEKMELQTVEDDRNLNTIPAFWSRLQEDGSIAALLRQAPDQSLVYGVCYNNRPSDSKTFEYSIAAPYGGGEVPEGFRVTEIPGRTWAVFSCKGAMPKAIQEMWHTICAEFFPASAYRPTYELDIEAYPDGDMQSPEYRSEIWVPVEKK